MAKVQKLIQDICLNMAYEISGLIGRLIRAKETNDEKRVKCVESLKKIILVKKTNCYK